MYHLYHTHGFVLKGAPYGEANRYISLFTRDFGLIKASALSFGRPNSKLRPGLLDFSYSRVTIVRGKSIWRITGVIPEGNIWIELSDKGEIRFMFGRVFALLLRLLHGEERNGLLFEHLCSAYEFCRQCAKPEALLPEFEYLLVLRVLHVLGYVGAVPSINDIVHSPQWSEDIMRRMSTVKVLALTEINRSLRATQL